MNVTFDVIISNANGKFKMLVQHYYSSPQVERFKISAGGRHIVMEKLLDRKRQPWKIVEGMPVKGDLQEAALSVMSLQNTIDYYLNTRNKDVQEGHIKLPRPKW